MQARRHQGFDGQVNLFEFAMMLIVHSYSVSTQMGIYVKVAQWVLLRAFRGDKTQVRRGRRWIQSKIFCVD